MKKMMTAALMLITTFAAFAQRERTVLHLRLADNSPFNVWVNGRQYSRAEGNVAHIHFDRPGRNHIYIEQLDGRFKRPVPRVVFNENVRIPNASEVFASVCPRNGFVVEKIVRYSDYDQPCHEPVVQPAACQPVPQPMDFYEFNTLLKSLKNAAFESTRMQIFKQALAYNYFSTQQVADVMQQFWFESSKVEVAKIAYPKVVDPGRYYLINNEFAFSSSVDELNRFLNMR